MPETHYEVPLSEAKAKTDKLQNVLPDIYLMIEDLLVYPEQKECFLDFVIDLLALADSENSFRENTLTKIKQLYHE